ncbi:hypothetical protein B0T09DRAFT_349897 [Sordaria sp. MPI-SDFR-AT-0083]|nr:hypothetical protein B0T09DRAFT_349897 [Sordaria sp. MPI-SDFR-AT-0083]
MQFFEFVLAADLQLVGLAAFCHAREGFWETGLGLAKKLRPESEPRSNVPGRVLFMQVRPAIFGEIFCDSVKCLVWEIYVAADWTG